MAGIETMVEEGVVKDVQGDELVVEIQRPDACGSCAARGACKTLGPTTRVIRVKRGADARAEPGDRVRLEIRTATFLRATFLGYMLPTLAFFAGVALVFFTVPAGTTILGVARDLASFAAGGAGVVLAFLGLWIAGSRAASRARYAPRIVEVLKETGSGC